MNSIRFEKILIHSQATIREAIESIDAGAIEIALVVDEKRLLVGVVTDGDIRRALLRGFGLDDSIDQIVHRDPITLPIGTDKNSLLQRMTDRGVDQIPLMRGEQVIDVAFIRDLLREEDEDPQLSHPVVLMAGGRGTRLHPLTEQTPKPMLAVGGRPLLERLLEQIRDAGFSRVLMAVNYRAEVIEEHFGDGSRFGVDIEYLRDAVTALNDFPGDDRYELVVRNGRWEARFASAPGQQGVRYCNELHQRLEGILGPGSVQAVPVATSSLVGASA